MNNLLAMDIIKQFKFYGKVFYVQWHITSKCTENCKHCYLDKGNAKDEFDIEFGKTIIDQICAVALQKNKQAIIAFTGGDPLLYRNIEELIKYSTEKGVNIIIKGTPWLISKEKIKVLKDLDIMRFHLSIDGTMNTHDYIRRKGSFAKTIETIRLLKDANMPVLVKYTVSKLNINEISEVLRCLADVGVDVFDFQRYSPSSFNDSKYMVGKQDYRKSLIDILSTYESIVNSGSKLKLLFRDHLWILLAYELGIISDDVISRMSIKKETVSGCTMANGNAIVINYNGDVLPCAKIPNYILGNINNQCLSEILQNEKLTRLSKIENYKGCSDCKLGLLCRGCPAVSYYKSKDVFDCDSQCWA